MKVLVAVEDSARAAEDARSAEALLGGAPDTQFVILSVAAIGREPSMATPWGAVPTGAIADWVIRLPEHEAGARSALQHAGAVLPRAHRMLVHGVTEHTICSVAEQIDAAVIVLGPSRSGRLSRALRQDTRSRILRRTSRPVLVLGKP